MTALTITCPWPPVCIGVNAKRRTHWSKYSPAAKVYWNACFYLAKQALGRRKAVGLPRSIDIEFYPPDALHRDDDNMSGGFKNGRDGIAKALGHDDRHWRGKVKNTFHAPHRPLGQIIVKIDIEVTP